MTSVVTPMTCRKDHDRRRRGGHRGRRTDLGPNGSRFTPYQPPKTRTGAVKFETGVRPHCVVYDPASKLLYVTTERITLHAVPTAITAVSVGLSVETQ